jgi:hypothetical protein
MLLGIGIIVLAPNAVGEKPWVTILINKKAI